MSALPRVSIIVPNYNHKAYLAERLESIRSQTFRDFELILMDDASTDGSLELLRKFADRPGTRLLVNKANSGSPFHQWNQGVEQAQGEYIWIAESDDSAGPEFLEKLVWALDRHPTAGLAECGSERIDDAGNISGPLLHDAHPEEADRWNADFLAEGREEIRRYLYLQNTIPSASAVVFRREMYQKAGPADTRFKLAGDWLQWVKILLHSDRYFLAERLSFSRIHQATQREAAARDGGLALEALEIQNRVRRWVEVDRATVRKGAERYALAWIQTVRSGRYRGPFLGHARCFQRLLKNDPWTASRFAARLPYALTAWALKNSLFRNRKD